VGVMMMSNTLTHRHHAPMRYFALDMLKLNGRMVDAEIVVQALLHISQNPFTYGWRNICNCDVAGERVRLRTDAPAVEVVNVIDAFD
jgi:hypothetical protein